MQIHFTDGDDKLYGPMRDAIRMKQIFEECVHHLCGIHFRDRGDLSKTSEVKKLGPRGAAYFNIVMSWIRSWCRSLERHSEHEHSRKLLEFWLSTPDVTQQGSLTSSVARQIVTILIKSFDPNKNYYLRCCFLDVISYDKESSQSAEVENSVVKRNTIPQRSISRNTEDILRVSVPFPLRKLRAHSC